MPRTKCVDMTGKRFYFLTVLRETEVRLGNHIGWLCRCDCGKEIIASGAPIRAGKHKSCGCKKRTLISASRIAHGHSNKGDANGSPTRTYTTWTNMLKRCRSQKHKSFKEYGGRGIRVCDKWSSFQGFLDDMGERPEGMTLGRIDNNKGYYKENCRWETHKQQARNRRNSRTLTYSGSTRTIAEWSEITGLRFDTLVKRLESGWPIEKALTLAKRGAV